MPYRDPEKRKLANRQKQARFRAKQRLASIGVVDPEVHPAQRRAARPPAAPIVMEGDEAAPLLSERQWTRQKIAIGKEAIALGLQSLRIQGQNAPMGSRDSLAAIRLGIDLLNSNLELPVEIPEEKFPSFQLMQDPIFADLAERSIIRQAELLLAAEG